MTIEESIETLKEYIDHLQTAIKQAQAANDEYFDVDKAKQDIEAFQMAIKAIEAQEQVDQSAAEIAKLLDDGYFERRMPDVVSQKDAKRLHCKICRDYCTCYRNPETCEDLKAFDSLPPVTPDASKVIEDIKTEIKETLNADWSDGLYQALRIIDRHISGKENE